jgi:ATP-binding cassette, subfamily B, bacterial
MTSVTADRGVGPGSTLRFVVRHWAQQPWRLALISLAMLAATAADIVVPVYAGRLVDALTLADEQRAAAERAALRAVAAMALLGVAAAALRWLALTAVNGFTSAMMSRGAGDAFRRVQRFSTEWHANSFAGSTVRSITRGMWAFDRLNDTVFVALGPALAVLVIAAFVLGRSWPEMAAVTLLGAAGFLAVTVTLTLGWVMPAAALSNRWDTQLSGTLADAIGCNAVVKAFGAEALEEDRLAAVLAKWRRRTLRFWSRAVNAGTAQASTLLAFQLAVVGTGVWLWWQGRATPGDLAFVITAYWVVRGYLRDIGHHVHEAQQALNEMEELAEIQSTPIGVEDRPGAARLAVPRGEVRFERVGFHYRGHAEPLFRDLSVRIAAGEKVGLVGHSGSGKSTFVKLLQRLHDVNEGRILIDGQDIAAVRQASLRSRIAIVPQDPILFHRSLAENIGYGRPGASLDEIEEAARLARAHEFIERLPRGYATLVGERGVKLSGGERQRVALARAFLADAPILVLDEATSSLDSVSERLIQEAITRLMRGRTAIVVAHRLSTIRAMDRILVFERGRIVEEGSHATLMARPRGVYRRLHEHQVAGLV